MRTIGIRGKIGAGKDEIAKRLVERWGYQIVRFSDSLKEEVIFRFPLLLKIIHDRYPEACICATAGYARCLLDMVYNRKPPEARALLQEYGTQVRRADDPNYWTSAWTGRAASAGLVVAPDVRFPNEAEAVLARGGLLWQVVRPGTVAGNHESETVMDGWRGGWDATIVNDGSIAALWGTVDRLMRDAQAMPAEEARITASGWIA